MSVTEDFIVELGTEELPPLSLDLLASTFHDNLIDLIKGVSLTFESSVYYATPRRLAVSIKALSTHQNNKEITRLGPAVTAAYDSEGNPKPAAIGFAKSCGISFDKLLQTETDKGLRLSYHCVEEGKSSAVLLPDLIKSALSNLPIAKAMRWGDNTHSFIRPVKWLLVMLGDEVVPCCLYSCYSSNISKGHRFMSTDDIHLAHANQYVTELKKHYVIVDIEARKQLIVEQVNAIAATHHAKAVIDPVLLSEVSAIVEWPVALIGNFDESFLKVPQEALITTMAKNQKYFHLENMDGELLPNFITISNIKSHTPASIVTGNERVIRPRLADAEFFFNLDSKQSLSSYIPKLKKVLFQKDLGSVFDKTKRIGSLALSIANILSIPPTNIEKASSICKSDLLSNMVKEFPSLQGIMGRYYAINDGESIEVSSSMDEIYLPRFAGDHLPSTQTGICLALADRIDTIVGIFAIGQIPSGNKDPFALRRSCLGVIRILIEKSLAIDLGTLIGLAIKNYSELEIDKTCTSQIMTFFNARIKAMYLDKGISNETIAAVLSLGLSNPLDVHKRLVAVEAFKNLPEAPSLAESNKRVANILSKNVDSHNITNINPELLILDSEQNLVAALSSLETSIVHLCSEQNYEEALATIVTLKPDIDLFFETVMVMDENIDLRNNRLAILSKLRALFLSIADISFLQIK